MKKAMLLTAMLLCLSIPVSAGVNVDPEGYTEKSVPVVSEQQDAGELPLRFYYETPNVPYMGINEYSQFMGKLSKAGIEINRKVLADLAVNNPEAFKAIVEKVK